MMKYLFKIYDCTGREWTEKVKLWCLDERDLRKRINNNITIMINEYTDFSISYYHVFDTNENLERIECVIKIWEYFNLKK